MDLIQGRTVHVRMIIIFDWKAMMGDHLFVPNPAAHEVAGSPAFTPAGL